MPFWKAAPSIRQVFLSWATIGIWNWSCLLYTSLQSCKLDLLALDHTGLDDAGLLPAASIPKQMCIRDSPNDKGCARVYWFEDMSALSAADFPADRCV